MKYYSNITFFVVSLILSVTIVLATDEIDCKKPCFTNPRECCIDPKIISYEIDQKCRIHLENMPEPAVPVSGAAGAAAPSSAENMIDHQKQNQQFKKYHPSSYGMHGRGKNVISQVESAEESDNNNSDNDFDEKLPSSRLFKRSYRENDLENSSEENSEHEHHHHGRRHHHRHHHHHHKPHHYNSDESDEDYHHRRHHGRHGHHGHHGHHRHHEHDAENYNEYHHGYYHEGDHHGHHHHHDRRHHSMHWEQFIQRMQKLSCYMECVANETGIMNPDNSFNLDNVKVYLTEQLKNNQQYLPIVQQAFETCVNTGEEIRQRLTEMPALPMLPYRNSPMRMMNNQQPKCMPWAGLLMRCVKTQIFINCPVEKFRDDDQKCTHLMEYLKSCPKPKSYYFSTNGARFSKA